MSFDKLTDKERELYNLGTAANSQGKYREAIEYFSEVIKRNHGCYEAYVNRGNAYSKICDPNANTSFYEEQTNNAIRDYNNAIEIDPGNGYAYYNKAVALYVKGDYRDSLSSIQKAKELGFDDIDTMFEKLVNESLSLFKN